VTFDEAFDTNIFTSFKELVVI